MEEASRKQMIQFDETLFEPYGRMISRDFQTCGSNRTSLFDCPMKLGHMSPRIIKIKDGVSDISPCRLK
ncbi:unnamed protein product [Dovyalis caffra]|uniref:Uncharacterized protein n=1 Tax=Dovyalis caffra TaxID=77055 RepID=A0AAV1RJB4_9ROSI|nr:unnamed protein product [Dovyalis caffra]